MSKAALSLLVCVVFLFSIGLMMVFNTTSAEILDRSLDQDLHTSFFKQLFFAALSIIAAFGVWHIGYKRVIKYSPWVYTILLFSLILVFVPGIGHRINGANRWVGFQSISVQPSEFVKILIPAFYIYLFQKKKDMSFRKFYFILTLLSIPLALIIIEPDNGTAAILLVTYMTLFFISRVKWLYWGLPLLLLTVTGGAVASQMPHVTDRIRVYLDPETDLLGKGHQPYQAKIATGSGGLTGRGVGESLQKLNYLPEARSDYIAAIYGEEFGFLGILVLILLYMLIAYFGFFIANRSKSRAGFYLAATLTFLICFQAFLNLGVVSGLLPSKGTNLPFFSQGGSSLLANAIAIALILNVAKERERDAT